MATTTALTGNFTGEKLAGYVYPAILSANSIGGGLVTLHENVKYKLNIRNMATTGFLADATCDFTPTGNVALSDIVLEPKKMQVNIELCKADFETQWEALEMKGPLTGQPLPASFLDFFIDKNLALVSKSVEVDLWQGTDITNHFEGFEAKLAANASVVDVTGDALTAANIIAELAKVRDAIPSEVFVADDVAIICSIKALKLYQQAQAALGYMDKFYDGKTAPNFMGIPLKVAHGITDDKMVACRASDLHFGTNVMTDMASLKVLDMADLDASDNVRFNLKFTAGTQITNPTNIVYRTVA